MTFDYIIVGAGSAGCILADRLSASGRHRVLLLEAGEAGRHPWIRMPMGFGRLYQHPRYNWRYFTQPQSALNGRRLYVPRGRVLGGSGAINAMIFVRGARRDFDDWAEACGDASWGYDAVLPYFRRMENHWLGAGPYHGDRGKIHVQSNRSSAHPLCNDFLNACVELGYERNDDFNGAQLEGVGYYDVNIHRGFRDCSADGYLRSARQRANLTVVTGAMADRLCADEQGRVSGVHVVVDGEQQCFNATREVIVCSGAIGTPALLERSGIGDPLRLGDLGVPVVHALPQVGERLQDHLCVSYYLKMRRKTLNDVFRSPLGLLMMGLQYLVRREGPLANTVNQSGGFFRCDPEAKTPDIQLYFNPLSYVSPSRVGERVRPEPYSGALLAANSCRPDSRGSVHIGDRSPESEPLIDPNFLATEKDQREMLAGGRLVREIVDSPAMRDVTVEEVSPGPAIQSDAQMLEYMRDNSGSIYHLCGSCAMGRSAADSVVNVRLRVHGMQNLRIADASIFPNITSGNINAPVMMVAEKAADMILVDAEGTP